MASTTLSIAMCTYNGIPYLREQLDSITAQSRLPDELVVCDDGSTDETVAVLEDFAGRAPFPVRIVRNPVNLGTARNFEQAIRLCSGDIIALSDQDDIWLPSKLHTLVSLLEASPKAGMAFSNGELVDEQSKPLGVNFWEMVMFTPEVERDFKRGWETRALIRRNYVTGATLAFRSKFRDLIIPVPDGWVHDYWIAFILSTVSDLVYSSEPQILYRAHEGQQIGYPEPTQRDLVIGRMTKIGKSLGGITRMAYALFVSRPARLLSMYRDRHAAFLRLQGYTQELRNTEKSIRDLVLSRLESHGFQAKEDGYLNLLNEAIDHHQTRLDLPQNMISRFSIACRELLAHRYQRHSDGFASAFRDIIG